jgi:hypothetical protein
MKSTKSISLGGGRRSSEGSKKQDFFKVSVNFYSKAG